jgi:anti-anti-sigma factor
MTALVVTTHHTRGGPVLALVGDLDHDNVPRFRAAVDTLTLQPGQLLTVDLAALTFCDSTGITALVAARNRARAHDADLALTAVPPPTLRILRLLGLHHLLPIHPAADGPVGT